MPDHQDELAELIQKIKEDQIEKRFRRWLKVRLLSKYRGEPGKQ